MRIPLTSTTLLCVPLWQIWHQGGSEYWMNVRSAIFEINRSGLLQFVQVLCCCCRLIWFAKLKVICWLGHHKMRCLSLWILINVWCPLERLFTDLGYKTWDVTCVAYRGRWDYLSVSIPPAIGQGASTYFMSHCSVLWPCHMIYQKLQFVSNCNYRKTVKILVRFVGT